MSSNEPQERVTIATRTICMNCGEPLDGHLYEYRSGKFRSLGCPIPMSKNKLRDQLAALLKKSGDRESSFQFNLRYWDPVAERVIEAGWRPPPRVIETAVAIAQERTGTVIRSRQGDIGSVDHGGNGEWTGDSTVIHMLDFATSDGRPYVGELDGDLASTFPWTVLWEPEEAAGEPHRIDVTHVAPGELERMARSGARPSPELRAAIDRARDRKGTDRG